jgi:t-SNARE complex subunit (syntaxin)
MSWDQHNNLERAKTSVKQIESMSVAVMGEMQSQTNQMRDLKLKVDDIDESLNHSNSIMDRMLKRAYRNRMMIFIFIFVLVAIFCLIMYFKFN